jgi:hypothetical protein
VELQAKQIAIPSGIFRKPVIGNDIGADFRLAPPASRLVRLAAKTELIYNDDTTIGPEPDFQVALE